VAGATTIQNDLPMQANWNASLEPEGVGGNYLRNTSYDRPAAERNEIPSRTGDNHLRNTAYQQRARETGNPLRTALEGYCPVQLQDNDRWVAGKPNLEMSYHGQIFHFSSDAARKRFEAAPEKYAPAQSGNDIVVAAEENRTVPGNVNHSAVWHGRLYLFSNSAALSTFEADPARYANRSRETALQIPTNSL